MRFFINDPLWDARVKVGVGFELKDNVENIHEEQHLHNMRIINIYADQNNAYHTGSSANFQSVPIGRCTVRPRCVESSLVIS